MRDSVPTDPRSRKLLEWYDRHARELPWRVGPAARAAGVLPDPYRVWLSEVMLQQTTVAAVKSYFETFTTRWPTVRDLADAEDADVMAAWAGLGYYARARNLLKCARVVSCDLDGRFPENLAGLLDLPGIGPYTAAAIAAIAYDLPETVIDGNVDRVMVRLGNIPVPIREAKPEIRDLAASLTPQARPGDHAQAVMDLGATICTPRTPACGICPLMDGCKARLAGNAANLPVKPKRTAKPVRRGHVFVARRDDGAWLLERRPDRGLLGGMLGWPGSDWSDAPEMTPPFEADWSRLPGEVRHTFTHFHLILTVWTATVPVVGHAPDAGFVPGAEFDARSLPTVMRKVWTLASDA